MEIPDYLIGMCWRDTLLARFHDWQVKLGVETMCERVGSPSCAAYLLKHLVKALLAYLENETDKAEVGHSKVYGVGGI